MFNSIWLNIIYLFNLTTKGTFLIFSNSQRSINTLTLDINIFSFLIYFFWIHFNTQIKMFSDLLISDYPNYFLRFLSIYNIISLVYNFRCILKVLVNTNLIINSITNLHFCASWFEREAWDLFGVFFLNNVDLRRILNDYGFHGHPLKKDFPLSGFSETSFSFISGVNSYYYINMTQEFRFFNINSPWKYYINIH